MSKALNYLGIARMSGNIELGEENAKALIKAGKARLVLLAADASEGVTKRVNGYVYGFRAPVLRLPFDASELGGAQDGWPLLIEGQKDDAAREAARKWAGYFDGASFATLVKTPVRFVVGFADTTCAPHAVYSAYNMCPAADKAIWHGLDMSHSVYGDLYRRGDEWRRKKE